MLREGRIIPDFIVIGAMKAGTTTLYRYFAQNPLVGMSRNKETDFFIAEKNFPKGPEWYEAQFDAARRYHGEASPNYTKGRDFPGVAGRIHDYCPEVRLIYSVRDPVARAMSQYRHVWSMGLVPDDLSGFADSHEYHHIMDASHYYRQIAQFLAYFPREAIHVVDFDQLIAAPRETMEAVYDFLKIPPAACSADDWQNSSDQLSQIPPAVLRLSQTTAGKFLSRRLGSGAQDWLRRRLTRRPARQPPQFPPELRQRMRDELREDAAQFRELTRLEFSGWQV